MPGSIVRSKVPHLTSRGFWNFQEAFGIKGR